MDFTISNRSFLNVSSSLIYAGQFIDLKPEGSVSHWITVPLMKKCFPSHMFNHTLNFTDKFQTVNDFEGIGTFFKE